MKLDGTQVCRPKSRHRLKCFQIKDLDKKTWPEWIRHRISLVHAPLGLREGDWIVEASFSSNRLMVRSARSFELAYEVVDEHPPW